MFENLMRLVFKKAVTIIVDKFNDQYPDDTVLDKVVERICRATEDDRYFARRVAEYVDLDALAAAVEPDWDAVTERLDLEELAVKTGESIHESVVAGILERLPEPLQALMEAKEPVLNVEDNPTLAERVIQRAAEMLLASAESAAAEGLLDNE
jgi:hypothetical protein